MKTMLQRARENAQVSAVGWLRWSEKYTRTDMVYLAGGGGWFLMGTGFSWAIGLLTALAFANFIPKETYGTYQYVLSIADIFGILLLSGIDASFGLSVSRGKDGSLWEGIRTKIRWGLLGGAGSVLLGGYYLLHANPMLGWAFVITGIAIPFWETPGIYVGYLQGKKRFALLSFADVGTQILAAAALIPALYWSKNLLVILAAYLISWGVARAFFLYLAVTRYPPNNERDPGMIPYGKHLTVMGAITNISAQVDTLLLWHLLGPAFIAVYVFAQALPLKATSLVKIVNRIAVPKLATQEHKILQETLPRKVFLLCALCAVGALIYAAIAPFIFGLFFRQYLDAVPYTQALAALIALQPFGLFVSSLTAQTKQKALYLYNFGVPAVRIALFLLLIPPFHLWGAVIALILVKIFDSALSTVLFYRS